MDAVCYVPLFFTGRQVCFQWKNTVSIPSAVVEVGYWSVAAASVTKRGDKLERTGKSACQQQQCKNTTYMCNLLDSHDTREAAALGVQQALGFHQQMGISIACHVKTVLSHALRISGNYIQTAEVAQDEDLCPFHTQSIQTECIY